MKWTKRALFLAEGLDLPRAAQVEGARWEPFQQAHLCDNGMFRLETKSRQIAWSFTVSAEAVASAMLEGESTVFVSINLEEAKEKVRYARLVYQNIQLAGLPALIRDNELGLEFSNGARINSLPSRPPRGRAKTHVVLDELAHVKSDKLIYAAALPIISKGGRLRIGSSPMGARGVFWEIAKEEMRPYPGYKRVITPWWQCRAFSIGEVHSAAELPTAERVDRYGNERIKAIHDNMPLEDFQQEFECVFVDESISWIPWSTIKSNQDPTLRYWHAKSVDEALALLPEIHQAKVEAHIEQSFVGGVDIGRKKHLTEIMLLGVGHVYPVRLMVSLDRVRYDDQEDCLRHILSVLPVTSMWIDENGIGSQLAENLARDTIAEGATFTNANKEIWAVEAKLQMERNNTPIPSHRDLAYQIHSIKKKVTPSKNNVFDCEASEKHHADKFWAWALAVSAARESRDCLQWGTVKRYTR